MNIKSNYPSISTVIQTIRQQISDVLLQKLLRRLPLPPYHVDPILRQFDQRFAKHDKTQNKAKHNTNINSYIL